MTAGVERFNALPDAEVREVLARCLAVERWIDEVASGRPYADRAGISLRVGRSAQHLSDEELASALSRHPRIGETLSSDGIEAAQSSREQSQVAGDENALSALHEGNLAYEQRFDRVFLIRAAGRSADEILSELERRLSNDDLTERAETVAQLCEIALLRLEMALEEGPS